MPTMTSASAAPGPLSGKPAWHADFLAMLPAIQRQAERAFAQRRGHEREEAIQAVLAHAAVAFARLVELGKPQLGYATPLARFAVRQYRAGRRVGARMNCRNVASTACQRRHGFTVEAHSDWRLALVEDRRTTPAEMAALRVDFADWLQTLSSRDLRLATALAAGERTSAVARLFRLTAGRVSQLRRELHASWRRFQGEPPEAAA